MSRFKRVTKDDLRPSSAKPAAGASAESSTEHGTVGVEDLTSASIVVQKLENGSTISIDAGDPANAKQDKTRVGWWLPEDAVSWSEIPQPEAGPPTKEKPLTVEQLMRREREFHLFGRGAGGKHVPDHSSRLIGFVVDYALHGAVAFLGTRAIESAYPDRVPHVQVIAVAVLSTWVLLSLIPLLLWRATPGKLLLGLRVVRVNGDETSAARAIGRGVVMLLVPLIVPDLLCVLFSPHRRRLIDYATATRIVANS